MSIQVHPPEYGEYGEYGDFRDYGDYGDHGVLLGLYWHYTAITSSDRAIFERAVPPFTSKLQQHTFLPQEDKRMFPT